MIICPNCNTYKHKDEFYRNKARANDRSSYCKPCMRRRERDYASRQHHNQRERKLISRYGITSDYYNALLLQQDNRCAVCKEHETRSINGKTTNLAVDHCHESGRVRGLLCSDCNTALGKLKEDQDVIINLLNYIRSFN